jgi:hypothetical protein
VVLSRVRARFSAWDVLGDVFRQHRSAWSVSPLQLVVVVGGAFGLGGGWASEVAGLLSSWRESVDVEGRVGPGGGQEGGLEWQWIRWAADRTGRCSRGAALRWALGLGLVTCSPRRPAVLHGPAAGRSVSTLLAYGRGGRCARVSLAGMDAGETRPRTADRSLSLAAESTRPGWQGDRCGSGDG